MFIIAYGLYTWRGATVCNRRLQYDKDPYAVAVMKQDDIVGHVPRQISAACSLFLRRSYIEEVIDCIIMLATSALSHSNASIAHMYAG